MTYELRPYRADRRQHDRRTPKGLDLEQTQFRACGWSLRYRRKLVGAADYTFALGLMAMVGGGILSMVAIPVAMVVGLCRWLF